jgi:hypothetical protein
MGRTIVGSLLPVVIALFYSVIASVITLGAFIAITS